MWAHGDYPSVATDLIAELGPRLVDAVGVRRASGCSMSPRAPATPRYRRRSPARRSSPSDLTPELFEAGRAHAAAAGVTLAWEEADAENLPYADASFDVVLSCVGVMFAPHHQRAADELVRVARPAAGSACSAGRRPGSSARCSRP